MANEVIYIGGYVDGDGNMSPKALPHVAGQPAKITADGYDLAKTPAEAAGTFKNDQRVTKSTGTVVGDQILADGPFPCTVVKGANKHKLTAGVLPDGTKDLPFEFPPSGGGKWIPGQKLYVSAKGKWDNSPAAANDPSFGVVEQDGAPATADDPLIVSLSF